MSAIRKFLTAATALRYFIFHPSAFGQAIRATIRSDRRPGGSPFVKACLLQYLESPAAYRRWIEKYDTLTERDRAAIRGHLDEIGDRPTTFSLVVLSVDGVDRVRETLDSIIGQLYPHWEVLVAGGEARRGDARIVGVEWRETEDIHEVLNRALLTARGQFVIFLRPGDELAEHALYLMALEIKSDPAVQVVYSDEDRIDKDGRRTDPHFKPDWNPDLLMSCNYMGGLTAIRTVEVQRLGGVRPESGGRWDWDLLLRTTQNLDDRSVCHVPHILCHLRLMEVGEMARDDGARRLIVDHLRRRSLNAEALPIEDGGVRVRYEVPTTVPLVSIIIPTRNAAQLLRRCVESILRLTDYSNYEVIVVDNQSNESSTLEYLESLRITPRMRVIGYDAPFNFADIVNVAARSAGGSLICLLNNDTEIISADWLHEMTGHALRPEVGAVGAMLYYPDDTVQHAGVILGIGRVHVAGHWHLGYKRGAAGYFGRLRCTQNLSAVTAACMMLRKSVFDEVGGMDADGLAIDFNDIDLCLRIRERGYRIVWTPFAELYHHESASRGRAASPRLGRSAALMWTRWGRWLSADPAYNRNLTIDSYRPLIAFPPRVQRPWRERGDRRGG